MSEIFQVNFDGKSVSRKFYDIPQEKIIEFQNALGFLPDEFLTFDDGLTYKICVQYATSKYNNEIKHPVNIITNVDVNGNNGIICDQLKCINEFEEYFSDYGMLYDVKSNYLEDIKRVYYVNIYWNPETGISETEERFFRKICEDYFWSYSLNADNIKLHSVNRKPSYKNLSLNLVGLPQDLPSELLSCYDNNKINLFIGYDNNFYKCDYIGPKSLQRFICIEEDEIKNEDILKTFFTIYKNYLNPNFTNSYPFYECGINGYFSKIDTNNIYYILHKIKNRYYLTHYSAEAKEEYEKNLVELNKKTQEINDQFEFGIFNSHNHSYGIYMPAAFAPETWCIVPNGDDLKICNTIDFLLNKIVKASQEQEIKNNLNYYLYLCGLFDFLLRILKRFEFSIYGLFDIGWKRPEEIKSLVDYYKDVLIKGVNPMTGKGLLDSEKIEIRKTFENILEMQSLNRDLYKISNLIQLNYKDFGFAKYLDVGNLPLIKEKFGCYKLLKSDIQFDQINYLDRPRLEDFILINNQTNKEENGVYYYRQLPTSGDYILIRQFSTCWDGLLSEAQVPKVDYVINNNVNINEYNNRYDYESNQFILDYAEIISLRSDRTLLHTPETEDKINQIMIKKLSQIGINLPSDSRLSQNSYARYKEGTTSSICFEVLLIGQENPNENGFYEVSLFDNPFDKPIEIRNKIDSDLSITYFSIVEKKEFFDIVTDNNGKRYAFYKNINHLGPILKNNDDLYYVAKNIEIYFCPQDIPEYKSEKPFGVENNFYIFKITNFNQQNEKLEFINDLNELNEIKIKYFKEYNTKIYKNKFVKKVTPPREGHFNIFIKDMNSNFVFCLDNELNSEQDLYDCKIKFQKIYPHDLWEKQKICIYDYPLISYQNPSGVIFVNNNRRELDDWTAPNLYLDENSKYYELLKSFGFSDDLIKKSRSDHLNEAYKIFFEKFKKLMTLTMAYYSNISEINNDATKYLQYLTSINKYLTVNDLIEKTKMYVDLNEELNTLRNNPPNDEIKCKDLIILKNLINNSPLKVNQNIINDLNFQFVGISTKPFVYRGQSADTSNIGLSFDNQNISLMPKEWVYELFNNTLYRFDQNPMNEYEYRKYKGIKLNITQDKCWFHTVPDDVYGDGSFKFRFIDYTLAAKFFQNYIEESTKINDKITINASSKSKFKNIIWGFGTDDVSGNFRYNLINEKNPNDNKFTKISFLKIVKVDNQSWHLYVKDNTSPLFLIQPKQGVTLDYDQSIGFIHNESIENPVDNSGIILTRLNLSLENDLEIYIKCNATSNDILETAFTKLIVKKL